MDFKMPKSQEQSKQLQDEKLEAIAGGRLDDLGKNLSLRGKVARWAAVAVSVGAVSGILAPSVQAINRVHGSECATRHDFLKLNGNIQFCFANKGDERVLIANVTSASSGNNEGYLETNKGRINFTRGVFINMNGPTTVTRIVIY